MTSSAVPAARERAPLRRPRACQVSGTSEALATHLGWGPAAVRTIFVLLTLLWGAGVLLYAWVWVFTPWQEGDAAPTRRVPVAWTLSAAAGVCLVGTSATLFALTSADVPISSQPSWFVWVGATTVFAVAAGMWATFVDRDDPARGPRHELSVRLTVTAILVALVAMQVAIMQEAGLVAFLFAVTIIAGIAAVYSSTLIAKWRELSGERVRRIREEQRAEMAAHLHDSVLQTLALIQNRAGASSEAARLARAQERELRSWLYDGDSPADSDLPTDLRDYAGALELDFPVRIDVVSAGLSTERASGEVAAAAREAMLNAARHAGGDVSVYIEGTTAGVDVYVRDRGQGFSLEAVPGDRLGVRESIIGRLRRAGGAATVRPGAGGVGTEVHLHFAGEEARRG
ncbi:ATP-binding protein [Microbacterium sulfonylureivorans]|uniref:ATP-binding protein n=1 Tax=Microbacterium sulfonylureivorans TaxID=2486854 RepID=UPI000FD88E75|nr:ATP-binding protein [Microbacterium sulfonylureivorans]